MRASRLVYFCKSSISFIQQGQKRPEDDTIELSYNFCSLCKRLVEIVSQLLRENAETGQDELNIAMVGIYKIKRWTNLFLYEDFKECRFISLSKAVHFCVGEEVNL